MSTEKIMTARKDLFLEFLNQMHINNAYLVFEDKNGGIGVIHKTTSDTVVDEFHKATCQTVIDLSGELPILKKNFPLP